MFSQLTSDTTAHEHFSIISMVGDAEMESHSYLRKEENEVMLGNQELRQVNLLSFTCPCSILDVCSLDNLSWRAQWQCNNCFQDQQSQFRSSVT